MITLRPMSSLWLGLLLCSSAASAAAETAGAPILKIGKAEYRLDQNLLELSFTVTNPGDTAIYLDCQGQPAATRQGKALQLTFAAADEAGADSARPQRIGARQGYQGHRRIHGLGPNSTGVAHASDPAGATFLKVEMAAYPERSEGEGQPWVRERSVMVAAKPAPLAKRGKRPPPPKPERIIKPVE